MLKNYILTAWKVFLRRKFFTFINLFGISITLAVIMVASTIAESFINPVGPEKHTGTYRIIDRLTLTNEDNSQTWAGGLGFKFIQDNVMRMQSPELISVNSGARVVSIYQGDGKLEKMYRNTDGNYWQILDFEFVAGRPYTESEVEQGQFVAVINQTLKTELFGEKTALNQSLTLNNQRFTIIGVVADVSAIEGIASAEIWLPYTTASSSSYREMTMGSWQVILYHSNPNMLTEIYDEYANLLQNDLTLEGEFKEKVAFGGAFTKLESYSNRHLEGEYSYRSGLEKLMIGGTLLLLLFMLLPSINMINLNVSRIMERSSEIGVRKAFGATNGQLVNQFIVESILLTLAGGALGMLMSVGIVNVIENSGLIPYAQFSFNWVIFSWGLIMILLFAIVSGAYPAIKMSRLNPVVALKGGA